MQQFIAGSVWHEDPNALDQKAAGAAGGVQVSGTPGTVTVPDEGNYGVVYERTMQVRAPQADTVTVQLWQKNHSAPPEQMRLAADPVRREVSKSGDDPLAPLRPSIIRLRLAATESSVFQTIRSSDKKWFIAVLVDGEVDVRGVYRPGLLDRPADQFASEPFELLFNDGLGQLQDTPLIQEGDDYQGVRSIVYWVCRCLNRMPDFLQPELAVASNWYSKDMTSSEPLVQEEISQSRWVEDGEPLSCWKVLEDLVGNKLGFLTQAENQWRLHQRGLYVGGGTFEQEVYDLSAFDATVQPPTLLRTETHDPSTSLGNAYRDRLQGSRVGERGSRDTVVVEYAHRTINDMLPDILYELDQWERDFPHREPSFASVGAINMPDVVYDDTKTVGENLSTHDGNSLSPPYETHKSFIRVEADGSGLRHEHNSSVTTRITVEVTQRFTALAYNRVILFADNGTTYYLQRDVTADGDGYAYEEPTWETSESFVAYKQDVGKQTGNTPQRDKVVEANESVEVSSLPDSGELKFQFWGLILTRPDLINDVGGGDDEDQIIYRVFASPLTSGEGNPKSRTTTVTTAHVEPDQEAYERTVLHGTGPTSAHPASTFVGGQSATDWAVGTGHSSGVPADELLARQALQQLAARLREHAWEVYDVLPHPTDVLTTGGRTFLPTHLVRHYKKGTTEVEWVEVLDAGVPITTSVKVGDGGGGAGGSGGGGGGATGAEAGKVEIGRRVYGSVPADTEVISHLVRYQYEVDELAVKAKSAPGADYSFTVTVGGSSITITLPAGQTTVTSAVGLTVYADEIVEVKSPGFIDSSLEDVNLTLKLIP